MLCFLLFRFKDEQASADASAGIPQIAISSTPPPLHRAIDARQTQIAASQAIAIAARRFAIVHLYRTNHQPKKGSWPHAEPYELLKKL